VRANTSAAATSPTRSLLVRWSRRSITCPSATPAPAQGRYPRPPRHAGQEHPKVATARQLLTWVYYAMRDGQVRALATATREAAYAGPDTGNT
jgi:hypothetical protein